MFTTSKSKTFSTVSQHDSQSIQQSTDEVSLHRWPAEGQPNVPLAYQGYHDDRQRFVNTTSADLASYPSTRPRRSRTSSLPWQSPWSLKMVIFIGDVILTIAPCIFLVLAFQALKVDHQPISKHGETIEQAAKLGPTLFPIIFAAVVGRFMRCYALWRAECGSSLGILEQLNGSQNLLAAFERAILLPGLGILSIGVVLLWALSPLGGQSALRVLGRGQDSTLGNITLYYTNVTGTVDSGAFSGASAYTSYQASLNAVFQASMTSLQLVNGSDIWGNIKIPVLDSVDTFKAGKEENGWYAFDETSYTDPYSALNGIVVSGLQDNKHTNFSMESSYFNMSCTNPVFFNMTDDDGAAQWGGFAEWVGDLYNRGTNASLLFNGLYAKSSTVGWNSYMIDTNYNGSDHQAADPKYNYVYASMGEGEGWIAAYNCTLGLFYIESHISCNGQDCHVQGVRPSQSVQPSNAGWPFPFTSVTLPANLLNWLSTATTQTRSAVISPIDYYISGSNSPFPNDIGGTDFSYTNVTGAFLAKRLQSLVNTGWQLAFQNAATAQSPPDNITALELSTNASTVATFQGGIGYPVISARATTIENHEVFVANLAWVAVTVIVAFILLFCGIAGLYFRYRSRSPDILGYVSSMTRDNMNFEQIPGGDKLGGMERARAMRHVRVQIADVKPWDGEGHITLRSLGHRPEQGEVR